MVIKIVANGSQMFYLNPYTVAADVTASFSAKAI